MADWYVSNEAINGYIVGNDTTGNGSAGNPYLTIAKAITVAANTGDTIYINGTTYTVNSVTVSKAVNLQPTVAYGTTIKTTNATRCLNISHTLGGTNTVGKLILDCDNVSQLGIQLTASAGTYSLVMNGTRIINAKNYGVGSLAGTLLANVTMSNDCRITSSNTAFIAGITLTNLNAGAVTITGTVASPGLTITATGIDSSTSTMVAVYATATTGVSVSMSGVVISATMSAVAATRTIYGALFKNIPNIYLGFSSVTISTAIANHRVEGLQITNSAGTYNSNNPYFESISLSLTSANTGHAILIGEEVPDGILDNKTNNATIRRVTVVGSDSAASAGFHGIMLGNNTGGLVYECSVSRTNISYIAKHNTGSIWYWNTSDYVPNLGQHFRSKAAQARYQSCTATVRTGYTGTFISNTENDSATVFSSSKFIRCRLNNVDNVSDQALNCPTGNTIYMEENCYSGSGALSFVYGATTYASLSAWQAAGVEKTTDLSARTTVPMYANPLSANYLKAVYI